jgi:aldehyde dehydrogenase (NAD+)/betaine-aldehyde dehydrogenase
VRAGRGAFDGGAWSRLGPRDRSDLLFRLADLIEANRPALVDLLIDEIGTPYSLANGGQTELPVANLRWFAEAARRGADGGFEQLLPLTGGTYSSASLVVREPIGVVAALTSYNFPLNLAAFKLGGALAAGCSVVLMPSPRAVLSTVALVRLVEETGIPPGAVNLVYGDPGIAERLVAHPAVDMVTFTGSAAVGSRVLSLAAPSLKRVVLELGGKSADIMPPSTDVAALAERATFGWTVNAGQGCGCTSRTLVPRSQYERYLDAACAFVAGMGCGDPRAKETVVGPLITDAHRRRVEGFIARAADAGADIGTGGRRPPRLPRGFYLEPTVISGVTNDAEIAQEELFGPVSVVLPYDSVEEAVQMANASPYGLNAGVWGPTSEAIEVARRLRVGNVKINGGGPRRADTPWGGYSRSGLGREGGELGLAEFFEHKHVQWPLDGLPRSLGAAMAVDTPRGVGRCAP